MHSGKQKAYQIKEMTDKLFEYFLVYSENDKPVEKERLDAATLFTQLWSESAMSLETEGFHVDMRAEESTCEVLANVPLLRRVFDNLVSNVRKYADPVQPVEAEMRACEGGYRMEERNSIADVPRGESSGIGIASCRKIMESHGGSFEIEKQGDQCVCRLFIPPRPPRNPPAFSRKAQAARRFLKAQTKKTRRVLPLKTLRKARTKKPHRVLPLKSSRKARTKKRRSEPRRSPIHSCRKVFQIVAGKLCERKS